VNILTAGYLRIAADRKTHRCGERLKCAQGGNAWQRREIP